MRIYEGEQFHSWIEKANTVVINTMKKHVLKMVPVDEDKCKNNTK